MKKICSMCHIEKDYSEYHKDRRRKLGIRSSCRDCHAEQRLEWRRNNLIKAKASSNKWNNKNKEYSRNKALKRLYDMTIKEYDHMLYSQNGMCAIHGCGNTDDGAGRRLHVDHDHVTGKIRGLLCGHCNHALGHVHDSVDILQELINYLGQ